jgi:single-strand DNA-binding protein
MSIHICPDRVTNSTTIINVLKLIKVMNNLRNSVRLIGFLGNKPEVKTVGDNQKLAKVSIATNEFYQNRKGAKIEETHWHNLVLWNQNADLAEKDLHKGSEVSIEGKLSSRSYIDKQGNKRYITEIIVNEIQVLSKKKTESL